MTKEQIIAIDKVNVSPVKTLTELTDADEEIWPFLERKEKAMQVGHYRTGNYHHYAYYINARRLLDAIHPKDGRSLLDRIVDRVVTNLSRSQYNPDKTVILHPPSETSYGEYIATAVQKSTGALYRHTLYRDSFAGQWRFSPFVQHGVPLDGCTVILIDDGTNTAETLMGLLDAATFGRPSRILVYVGITRLPPHKVHLLRGLDKLNDVSGRISVNFAVKLGIPVYSSRTCPVCKFRSDLSRIEEYSHFLRQYAYQMKNETEAVTSSYDISGPQVPFLWRHSSAMRVTRLREAIELMDYHAPSAQYVGKILEQLATYPNDHAGAEDPLLDLGFVICVESVLADSAVFATHLKSLLETAIARIPDCPEEHLITIVGLAFHLARRLGKRKSAIEDMTYLSSVITLS